MPYVQGKKKNCTIHVSLLHFKGNKGKRCTLKLFGLRNTGYTHMKKYYGLL